VTLEEPPRHDPPRYEPAPGVGKLVVWMAVVALAALAVVLGGVYFA
jgi:hypothetical protein